MFCVTVPQRERAKICLSLTLILLPRIIVLIILSYGVCVSAIWRKLGSVCSLLVCGTERVPITVCLGGSEGQAQGRREAHGRGRWALSCSNAM